MLVPEVFCGIVAIFVRDILPRYFTHILRGRAIFIPRIKNCAVRIEDKQYNNIFLEDNYWNGLSEE